MNSSLLRYSLLAAVLATLAACHSPMPSEPPLPGRDLAPPSWSESSGARPSRNWILEFESQTLATLVAEAEASNFGLIAAEQQANAAAAAARLAGSLRGPSLSAGLRSSRSQTLSRFSPPVPVENDSHALNLSARWEVDLWNRLGLEHQAAKAQYQVSQYEFEALRLSLASQVAKSWFSAIAAKTQHELAQSSADSFASKLATLERRYARGLTEAFDLRLTRAQASASRADAIQRRSEMDAIIRNLETLLGRYPSAELQAIEPLPTLQQPPAAGLPADLLVRRPDILAQQNRLAAALSLEQAARRNWLPSLNLTASDGTLSPSFSDLLNTDFNVWSLVAEASLALFQSGRLAAERQQLSAKQQATLAQYQDLLLQAFREVETALRAEADLLALESQTQASATENQQAEEQAWRLYERGLADITSVLDAERRSFDAKSQLISIRNQRLQNRINLHVALGGDL